MATKGPKSKLINAVREVKIQNEVASMNPDSVTKRLASTQLDIQKAISGVTAAVIEQFAVLSNLEQAALLKKEELKQLHNIEVTSTTHDDLLLEIEETKTKWQEEKERNDVLNERANEEYLYEREQSRRRVENEHNDKLVLLQKGWMEREEAIQGKEQAFVELNNVVAAFPAEKDAAVKEAVAVATNSVKRHYETEARITEADHKAQLKVYAQQIDNLNNTVVALNKQLDDIKGQLNQAHRDNKEIAAKAVEGASSKELAASLQRAMETQQGNNKGK